MSGAQTNPGFVPDECSNKGFSVADNKGNKSQNNNLYTVESLGVNESKEVRKYDDYDPFLHRNVEHPTTNAETLLHFLKGSLGTGILAMPNAFYHAGYILGFVGTFFLGGLLTYTIHLLINAQYELAKRRKVPSLTYPATAEAACLEGPPFFKKMTPYAPHVVNAFLFIYQIGSCSVYIVFIATNVKSICDVYIEDLDIKIYMLMFLLPLILLNYVRNLKHLAPFSTIANIITVVSFGIIFYYIIEDNPTFEGREPVGKINHIPLFLGTVVFALESVGVIMPLENEMKTPRAFHGKFGILNRGMFIIVLLYVGMGLLGYLSYGSDAEGSITLNLPKDEILSQVMKGTLAFAIFITYGLQCYVAVDIAWNEYLSPKIKARQLFWEYVTRTYLVLMTFLLAIAVPKLDLFISLFGALCLSVLGLAIPALIDTATYYYTYNGTKLKLIVLKNMILVITGLALLIIGTSTSLHDIIVEFT